jgi:prolipoprotein diacylglyceryltransferase
MPKDKFVEEVLGDPDKRAKLFTWILTAQIISVILIVVGGIIFILWALNVF